MKFFLIALWVPLISFSQTKTDYTDIMPKGVVARPLLDSLNNYIPDSLKQIVLDYINSKNIDPNKCFIDKNIYRDEKAQTVDIRIEDVDDWKHEKEFEIALKKKQNPPGYIAGFSGTLHIDAKSKKLIYFSFDQ